MFELIGWGIISVAQPAAMPVVPRHPGEKPDGQFQPIPESFDPSWFSVFKSTSNCSELLIHLLNPSPTAERLVCNWVS